jgi:hypothetical protein
MRLSWQKSQKSDPVKAFPRSVMILLGTSNWWVMSSMNFAASVDVIVATVRTSIHLVNLSPQDVLVAARGHLEGSH